MKTLKACLTIALLLETLLFWINFNRFDLGPLLILTAINGMALGLLWQTGIRRLFQGIGHWLDDVLKSID